MTKNIRAQINLINQALNNATSSINLARQLLREVQADPIGGRRDDRHDSEITPGVTGTFDGRNLVTSEGKKHEVPENYASKTHLVHGDTLKLISGGGRGRDIFKQIGRVRRQRVEGILARKDGKWHIVTADGSYLLLKASVDYHRGQEGDEAVAILPQDKKQVPFAALEAVPKRDEERRSLREKEAVEPKKVPVAEEKVPEEPKKKVSLKTEEAVPAKKVVAAAATAKKPAAKAPAKVATKAPERKTTSVKKTTTAKAPTKPSSAEDEKSSTRVLDDDDLR